MRPCGTSARSLAPLLLAALVVGCGIPSGRTTDWSDEGDHPFTTGPYILLGDGSQAYIALKAKLETPPIVEWWPESQPAQKRSVPAHRDIDLWVSKLVDLPPTEHILYRVVYTGGATPAYRFRVGVPANQPFRFAVFGDTRTGHAIHRAVVLAVAREEIDFVVNTGDLVDRGGIKPQWDRFFQIEHPLLVDTPIVPSVGNHDWSSRRYFRRYFMMSRWTGDRRYYVHDWGNFRLVVVDAGIECRDGCAQYAFAERALSEGAKRGMLMAISLHYPPYSSGQHGSNRSVQEPIKNLARRYGVELVLTGHDHNYERTKVLDGTTYIVSGSAGAPVRPVDPQPFTAHARTEPHYVLVDVENNSIALRAVNLQGDVFDSVVIKPNPPRR